MAKFKIFLPVLMVAAVAVPATAQQVMGVTATQAVLHYQAPSPAACQVQVSTNRSFTPLAADVDPALFTGANLDSRTGNVTSTSLTDRYFVVGRRRADLAADGKHYSRALQAFTEYFYQITCAGNVQSGRFVTANPPLGNNFPEPAPFDATSFGNYAWPTIDWNDQSKTYVDPLTGILIKRAASPGWYGGFRTGKQFLTALDLNGTWSNVSNLTSGTAATTASYSGPGGDPVFLALDPAALVGDNNGTLANSGWSESQTLDNILVRIYGTGSGVISGCLSDDSGAHCISPPVNMVTLSSGGGNPAGAYPTACTSDSATGCFPNNGVWGGWNFTPIRGQISATSGLVNVAGPLVTPADGTRFDLNWKAGGKIYIAGSAPQCANNLCTIALVNTSASLTIQEIPSTLSGAAFKTANSGIVVWVNKTSGTHTASISANFDFAYSDQNTIPGNGTWAQCSSNPTTVSWAADGVTPITPVAGELCIAQHPSGAGAHLYLLIPSTGETRFLSPLFATNPSDAAADQIHSRFVLDSSFDATDPNTIYLVGQTGAAVPIPQLFKGVYDANTYRYKAYPHSLYPAVDQGYFSGESSLFSFFPGTVWPDTGITWTDQTKVSQQKDFISQIAANDLNYTSNLFLTPVIARVSGGRVVTTSGPVGFGETIGLIDTFDTNTGNLDQVTNTWSTWPARWCAIHASVGLEGWFGLSCNPLSGPTGFVGNQNLIGVGPWQMTPTAVLKNGTFSSDTSLTATSPNDPCPVIPSFLTSILPANPGCVTFRSNMACSQTPATNEAARWPCDYNPAWSKLQDIAPGDGIIVINGQALVETLLVVAINNKVGNTYDFTAVRGTTSKGYQAAPNGWKSYAVPPLTDCDPRFNCGGSPGMWLKMTDPPGTVTWRMDPGAFQEHGDLGNGPTPGANTFCLSSACRYNIPFDQQIGTLFTKGSVINSGSFGGVAGGLAIQGYPSVHQLTAPPSEKVWMMNFRHLNPSAGAGTEVIADVGPVTYSLMPGTRGVFKFTSIAGGVNYKQVPVVGYAGYHLLQENSSPATGNIITDATPWQFCIVLNAGECQTGSQVGEGYMSVPSASIRAGSNCVSNWYDDNYPCLFTPPAQAAFVVQQGIAHSDLNGTNWRRITMGFSGYGRQYQFASSIPDPTGAWTFFEGFWLDGVRNELMMAKLPPWPNPQDVTTNRSNFVPQVIQIGANPNLPNARVRFGYAENGAVSSFYCTPRRESCVASGTPYSFTSETQGWQSCSGGCSISVPAIPGRVLFYTIERQDGSSNTIPGETLPITVR